MLNIFKLAARNLRRYLRRTLLTVLLIVLGVTLVILFSGLSGSFKSMMIGIITDSNLGHLQLHRKGYVASIDTLPLNFNLKPAEYAQLREKLDTDPQIAGYAPRIKVGAMLSNFMETTSVRITAIDPDKELVVSPALPDRIKSKAWNKARHLLGPGEILVPMKIANALSIKEDDAIVLVATNRDGSVNGLTFKVVGLVEDVAGPQGKDGFIHLQDARTLLRIDGEEVSEVAVRVKDFSRLEKVRKHLAAGIADVKNPGGKPLFELHSWAELTPFATIAKMIDLLTVTMKIIMIGIVLISILNVMLMSVYERVREIGTIAAIGTSPMRIMGLFLAEGLFLGLIGATIGIVIGVGGIALLNLFKVQFTFAQMNLVLAPTIQVSEILTVSATVLFMAVAATLQPAWKASRMEPVDALRHV
ncbi:MAG: ABC transporter substrate-binding protein [Deltaproteobacteria bacterium HGW-Deltaproteobacteria-8]|jgi:putative ABC transport system permease protein|nr:MAG: ABC transporter substrate-binding protein [Deltaproteobacteria bacterium HGW-Deltaproteobacteria-8]